jgi:uncharacterized membrane protein YwzB
MTPQARTTQNLLCLLTVALVIGAAVAEGLIQ